jgi:copper chaperone CopZ
MEKATAVMTLGSDYDASRAVGLTAKIAKLDGVQFVDFNYMTNKVTVNFDPARVSLKDLKDIVTRERGHHDHSAKSQSRSPVNGGSA